MADRLTRADRDERHRPMRSERIFGLVVAGAVAWIGIVVVLIASGR